MEENLYYYYFKKKEWVSWSDFLGTNISPWGSIDYFKINDAKKNLKKFKIDSFKKWNKFKKSRNFNIRIPQNPANYYNRKKTWKNWFDFFNRTKKEFIDFNSAKKIVYKLKIKTTSAYKRLPPLTKQMYRLPAKPNRTYKNKGWKGFQDFLNVKYSHKTRKLFSYRQAKRYLKRFKIKSMEEFRKLLKEKKYDLDPRLPRHFRIYQKNKSWINLADYLSLKGDLSRSLKKRNWKSFKECKKIAIKNNILNHKEWVKFVKNRRDYTIPRYPHEVFNKRDWKGWVNFLDSGYYSFKNAKIFARKSGIKTCEQWRKQIKLGKIPRVIPSTPDGVYANKGWKGWKDFLGTG